MSDLLEAMARRDKEELKALSDASLNELFANDDFKKNAKSYVGKLRNGKTLDIFDGIEDAIYDVTYKITDSKDLIKKCESFEKLIVTLIRKELEKSIPWDIEEICEQYHDGYVMSAAEMDRIESEVCSLLGKSLKSLDDEEVKEKFGEL